MRATASVRGVSDGEQVLDVDDLDRPEERRARIIASPVPNDDRAGMTGEPRLAREQQHDRERVRRAEALAEERHGEQRDPDDERLLDERGLRRLCACEALEEEDERHAAADHGDAEQCEPVPAARRHGGRRASGGRRVVSARTSSSAPATAFFAVV